MIAARAVGASGLGVDASGPRPQAPAVVSPVSAERDARWSFLLICVAVYQLTAVSRLHQIVPAIAVLRPAMLSAAATLALIGLDPKASGRISGAWAVPGVRWLAALLIWAALSVPMALYVGGAFDLVLNHLTKAIAMVGAAVIAVRGTRDVKRMAAVFFIGIAYFALMATEKFPVDADTGRLDNLVYYDANEFSLLAACSMPFGAFFVWRTPNWIVKAAIVASMGVMFTVFVSSGSRGAFLALIAGLLATVTTLRAIKLRWRLTLITVVTTAFVVGASGKFWERMDTVDSGTDYNITSPTGRIQVWKRGIGYMMQRPFLGVGAGNFATAEGRLSDYAAGLRSRSGGGIKWSAAHNSFVQVGAELGVPGLVFFCAVVFGTTIAQARLSQPRRDVPSDPEFIGLASASFVALVIFIVGATFLSLAYSDMLFTLLAISMGLQVVARRRAKLARLVPG